MVYLRNVRQENNDCSVPVHTSVDYGDVCEKISAEACSGKEISGLLKIIRR